MPGAKLILDTNAVIAWLREDDAIRQVAADCQPTITLFTVGEMFYGIGKSARPEANERALERALGEFDLLYPDLESARQYGTIFSSLRSKGRPIPVNDIWIAALALQHRLALLTRDTHFREVDGLAVLEW